MYPTYSLLSCLKAQVDKCGDCYKCQSGKYVNISVGQTVRPDHEFGPNIGCSESLANIWMVRHLLVCAACPTTPMHCAATQCIGSPDWLKQLKLCPIRAQSTVRAMIGHCHDDSIQSWLIALSPAPHYKNILLIATICSVISALREIEHGSRQSVWYCDSIVSVKNQFSVNLLIVQIECSDHSLLL